MSINIFAYIDEEIVKLENVPINWADFPAATSELARLYVEGARWGRLDTLKEIRDKSQLGLELE